jgi:hypothetical protein
LKLVTTLKHVSLCELPNGPRRKEDYKTRTEYERPFEYTIVAHDKSRIWTVHNVKFLLPCKSFILTSTGEGFKDPLEAALYVDSMLSSEHQEAAE